MVNYWNWKQVGRVQLRSHTVGADDGARPMERSRLPASKKPEPDLSFSLHLRARLCQSWVFLSFLFFSFFKVVAVVGFMDRRLDLPEGLDPRVASIICDCFLGDRGWGCSDPERRPSFQEIVGRMAELTGAVASAPAHRSSERSTGGAPPGC